MINVAEKLSVQGWALAHESGSAHLFTPTPWVAPMAYLHWVFKPANADALSEIASCLPIRDEWLQFLKIQNGANLYSDALSIFGAVTSRTLMNRGQPLEKGPFSILDYRRRAEKIAANVAIIGTYTYDGSPITMDASDGQISVFRIAGTSFELVRQWPNVCTWMAEELQRLKLMFEPDGRLSGQLADTVPTPQL